MSNTAIFTVWGLVTALFIPTDWMPDETLAQMVTSMQRFLLLTLIAYTGGRTVHNVRDDVVGTAAAIGILTGTEDPMFIGAMVVGPLGGWLIKKVDGLFAGRISVGFEMLVNNFLTGILGALLAVFGYLVVESLYVGTKDVLMVCVNFLVKRSLLPLTSLFMESAKILFLSDAINRGVFTPLGMDQAAEAGKSISFLIEADSGPGLGLLLAYNFLEKGAARSSAPSAVTIYFLGGTHKIYFPYVLVSPLTVLAVMVDGMSGVFINSIFNSGLVPVASPGSIITISGICVKDNYIGVILSVIVTATVSLVIAAFIPKFSSKDTDDNALEEANAAVSSMESEAKGAKPVGTVDKIVFAYDTGTGSSAIGATTPTKKFNVAGIKVTVKHFMLDGVPEDTQVIVMYKSLVERAETRRPSALIFPVTSFMGGKEYDEIIAQPTK